MRGLLKRVVSEPGADTAESFVRRIRMLAATYTVLFCACCAGEVVLAVYGKLFVTLAQRSNVETLTVLFLLVFYGYPLLKSERATLRPHEVARIEVKIDGARGDERVEVGLDYPPR